VDITTSDLLDYVSVTTDEDGFKAKFVKLGLIVRPPMKKEKM
jgi:hypothetical protein